MSDEKKTVSDAVGESRKTLDRYELRAEEQHKSAIEANKSITAANKTLIEEREHLHFIREEDLRRNSRYEEQDCKQWARNEESHTAYLEELVLVRQAREAQLMVWGRIAKALEDAVELEREWQNKAK